MRTVIDYQTIKKGRGIFHMIRGKKNVILMNTLFMVVLAGLVSPSDGFFFPKSLFRNGASEETGPTASPSQQQHPRVPPPRGNLGNTYGTGDTLQGSGTDIQSALRILNRPPPPRNVEQGRDAQISEPGPGSGFNVPKELCLACESVPWTPVAGGERSPSASASANIDVSPAQQTFSSSTPTKTIVINALGQAKGPVPIPPGLPNRRPFAIQFDGNQSGNKLNEPTKAPSQSPQSTTTEQETNEIKENPGRHVTFQIIQAEAPEEPGISTFYPSSAPIGMQPPPVPIPQVYGHPTILRPLISHISQASPSFTGIKASPNQQTGLPPPPNPLTVGTIVATQQNNGARPEFQEIEPAKLVYQEHTTSQFSPPSPQNFKVPIISQPFLPSNSQPQSIQPEGGYNSNSISVSQIPLQQNFRPPPLQPQTYRPGAGIFLRMRPPPPFRVPPQPSQTMKPPGVLRYGNPIRIPANVRPQRPSGHVHFPTPQAFLQISPPSPLQVSIRGHQTANVYGPPLQEANQFNTVNRPQDDRRPPLSGKIIKVIHSQTAPVQNLNTNSIQPPPIPVSAVQNSNHEQNAENQPGSASFTQESGWEIIPSIQTDLTHLFIPEQGKQQSQTGNELPTPVPIPETPKDPIFIVSGANQQHNQQQNTQIKVQDVTYHEEGINPGPTNSTTLLTSKPTTPHDQQQLNIQTNVLTSDSNESKQLVRQPENQQILSHQENQQLQQQLPIVQSQIIRPRPFILGIPTSAVQSIIFRPQHEQRYEPLHPSIMTALKHAQQTSLLTHQYLSQSNVGQPIRDNSVLVTPVPAPPTQSQGLRQNQQQVNNGDIDPRIPVPSRLITLADQTNANCQNTNQHLIPITMHQKLQQLKDESKVSSIEEEEEEEEEEGAPTFHPSTFDDSTLADDDDQSFPSGSSTRENKEDDASASAQSTFTSLTQEPTASTPFQPSISTGDLGSSGIRGSVNIEDNGNKGSYMLYYSRPGSKSPVYWVQPSRTLSQGVVRLSPQITPTSSSVASSAVSWSRPRVVVANQFRTQTYQPEPTQEGRAEEENLEKSESEETENVEQTESEQVSDVDTDEQIPYGQKLGVSRENTSSQTPYDIISVSGSDDDDAQSLENDSLVDHSKGNESAEDEGKEHLTGPEFTSIGNDDISTTSTGSNQENEETPRGIISLGEYKNQNAKLLQNENNLQNVHETQTSQNEADDTDDERDDFGFRPQTVFRKPISTTVIHSPGASSFQSLKLPNFKPHRVIVHDFTTHSANAAATGPSAPANESQGILESSESQEAPASETVPDSWKASQKLKAPKFVENDAREEISSESIHQLQGFTIQDAIGPVSTADCVTTAHNSHLLSSHTSTSPKTTSTSGKSRDIYLPLGSRFPGGRPSIFSAVKRTPTTTVSIDTSSSTTTKPSTYISSSEREPETIFQAKDNKGFRIFAQNPSGFAASIPVPVYRRPTQNQSARVSSIPEENRNNGGENEGVSTRYIRPQANIILSSEDIYKNSEVKEGNRIEEGKEPIIAVESSTSTPVSLFSVESETIDSVDEIMSTEKSSSFSVSVVDDKGGFLGLSGNEDERAGSVGSNDLQQVDEKPSKPNIVHVNSVPVVTDVEPIRKAITTSTHSNDSIVTSTTAIPSPASTSTKIVKTVRVRQRMRSGSFNGPLRTRFHGAGRVRVVHRPSNQEYIRHFPEFSTQEGDKLAKEEEQEVKNALIELKKSPESKKTH